MVAQAQPTTGGWQAAVADLEAADLRVRDLGGIGYGDAMTEQLQARERVLAGGSDELLLLEHDPAVVTLGRRGGVVDRAALARLDTEVVEVDRGGLATWHGPGQIVGYPIVDLQRRRVDISRMVAGLGRTMQQAATAMGVKGVWYDAKRPGVYVGGRKLGSIGLHIHKMVTTHGFALNVCCGLDGFQAIEPCGDATLQITTIAAEVGRRVTVDDVKLAVLRAFDAVLADLSG